MKREWNIPTLEVLDVKKTAGWGLFDPKDCIWFWNWKNPECKKPPGGQPPGGGIGS